MNRSGSVLLLIMLILTPLLLISASLWRSVAYITDLVHACHTDAQRMALSKAGLVLVLKRLNNQRASEHLSFKHWPYETSDYAIEIKLIGNGPAYQATAHLYYKNTVVYSLSAHYYADGPTSYRLQYDA